IQSGGARSAVLGMTAEAKVPVANGQKLGVDRAMRIVAGGARFTYGRVLKDKRPRLGLMTLGARFVQARHGQTAGRLHDVQPVRVMALHAIHFALGDGVMLGAMNSAVLVKCPCSPAMPLFSPLH